MKINIVRLNIFFYERSLLNWYFYIPEIGHNRYRVKFLENVCVCVCMFVYRVQQNYMSKLLECIPYMQRRNVNISPEMLNFWIIRLPNMILQLMDCNPPNHKRNAWTRMHSFVYNVSLEWIIRGYSICKIPTTPNKLQRNDFNMHYFKNFRSVLVAQWEDGAKACILRQVDTSNVSRKGNVNGVYHNFSITYTILHII